MCVLKLNKMEDILSVPKETKTVEIQTQEVLSFLYRNNRKLSEISADIDIEEIRKSYINNLQRLYGNLEPMQDDIIFNIKEIMKRNA